MTRRGVPAYKNFALPPSGVFRHINRRPDLAPPVLNRRERTRQGPKSVIWKLACILPGTCAELGAR